MSEVLTVNDFVLYLRTRFRVTDLDNYYLELSEVIDTSNDRLEQFSLTFVGVASPWLPQASYKLEHPQMGECELFLVPNGPNGSGMRYEAVFSRFISPE